MDQRLPMSFFASLHARSLNASILVAIDRIVAGISNDLWTKASGLGDVERGTSNCPQYVPTRNGIIEISSKPGASGLNKGQKCVKTLTPHKVLPREQDLQTMSDMSVVWGGHHPMTSPYHVEPEHPVGDP
jgi:hypothetical protein